MSRISQFFCTLFQFIDMSKCNRYNQSKKGGFYMHFTFKEIAFDDHLLIKSFDLFLHPGECIIITGESGCGKTTLFNALTAHNDFLESAPSLTISAQKQKPLLCEDLTLQMQYEMIGSDATLFQHFDLMTHLNDYPACLSGVKDSAQLRRSHSVVKRIFIS